VRGPAKRAEQFVLPWFFCSTFCIKTKSGIEFFRDEVRLPLLKSLPVILLFFKNVMVWGMVFFSPLFCLPKQKNYEEYLVEKGFNAEASSASFFARTITFSYATGKRKMQRPQFLPLSTVTFKYRSLGKVRKHFKRKELAIMTNKSRSSVTCARAWQKQRSICFCLDFFAPLFVSRQKVE